MDNDVTMDLRVGPPPKYLCEVHGTHTAVMHVRAVTKDRKEERHYCMFCMIERFDKLGLPKVTLEVER